MFNYGKVFILNCRLEILFTLTLEQYFTGSFKVHYYWRLYFIINRNFRKFSHAPITDFSSLKADPLLYALFFVAGSFFMALLIKEESSSGPAVLSSRNHLCCQYNFLSLPSRSIHFTLSSSLIFLPCLLHSPRTHIKRGPTRSPTCGLSPATSLRDWH